MCAFTMQAFKFLLTKAERVYIKLIKNETDPFVRWSGGLSSCLGVFPFRLNFCAALVVEEPSPSLYTGQHPSTVLHSTQAFSDISVSRCTVQHSSSTLYRPTPYLSVTLIDTLSQRYPAPHPISATLIHILSQRYPAPHPISALPRSTSYFSAMLIDILSQHYPAPYSISALCCSTSYLSVTLLHILSQRYPAPHPISALC